MNCLTSAKYFGILQVVCVSRVTCVFFLCFFFIPGDGVIYLRVRPKGLVSGLSMCAGRKRAMTSLFYLSEDRNAMKGGPLIGQTEENPELS